MKDPWFPVVVMFTVLLAVWLGIFGPLPLGVTGWIDKWQTLIGAFVAVGAAIAAYWIGAAQLGLNEAQERQRRRRKLAAVRAMLPLALTQIIEYAQNSAAALNALIPLCQGETFPRSSPTASLPQPLPNDTVKALTEFVEYSDEMDVSVVENMIAWVQVHDARVRTLVRENHDVASTHVIVRTNIEGYVVDAAALYASAAALFEYARRRQSHPPTLVLWENVRSAFTNMGIWDHEHPRLYSIVGGREKRSRGPFDALAG